MSRIVRVVMLAAVLFAASRAHAESQAEIAARENAEGEKLLAAKQLSEAASKFRDAVARVPEPHYFYNLCDATYQQGRFGEALTACDAAVKTGPSAYEAKAKALIEKIKDDARKQKIVLKPA